MRLVGMGLIMSCAIKSAEDKISKNFYCLCNYLGIVDLVAVTCNVIDSVYMLLSFNCLFSFLNVLINSLSVFCILKVFEVSFNIQLHMYKCQTLFVQLISVIVLLLSCRFNYVDFFIHSYKFIIELILDILDLLGFKLHQRNKKKSFSMTMCMSVREIS